jgi:RNA 2',3'-cyclic 3'-phosphodiesterase
MPRLFVAIDIPEELKPRLLALRTAALPARWVEPEQFHLTLRFIGEVDEASGRAVDAALRGIDASRFTLRLKGLGHFRRHVLWVGVQSCPPLMSLQTQIEDALRRAGLAGDEGRYVPHVKLARLKWPPRDQLRSFLNEHALFCAEPFEVEHFVLYESRLAKQGATHLRRAAYALYPIRQNILSSPACRLMQRKPALS